MFFTQSRWSIVWFAAFDRFDEMFLFATPRTPPLWQRGFFLINCLMLRRLLRSVRSGVAKNFRCRDEIMSRKWIAILAIVGLVAMLVLPILVGFWEHRSLASAKTFTDTCALLGEPVESFDSISRIAGRFGNWDFHDIASNEITFTPDLPLSLTVLDSSVGVSEC